MLLGAYLIGSIPTAYLLVKLNSGEDLRYLGDGNLGAKNTYESVGRFLGLTVAAIDIGKGFLAVTAVRNLGFPIGIILLTGACVVIGYDFSIFLRFNGGQGMATTIGVFGALFPQVTLFAFLVFLVLLALTGNWELSCGIALFLLVAGLWITDQPARQVLFSMFLLTWIAIMKYIQSWQARRLTV